MTIEISVDAVGVVSVATVIIAAAAVVRHQVKALVKDVDGLGTKTSNLSVQFAELKGLLTGLNILTGGGSKKEGQ